MLEHWCEAGFDPASFWDQSVASFNAAMTGRLRGRNAEAKLARNVALIGAYYAGQLAQADWAKMPDLHQFLAQFEPRPKLTNAEIAARFRAMAAASKRKREEQT